MYTPEIQFRSIEEEERQDLNQVCPRRLDAVYCLIISEASPFLAIEVEVACVHYQSALVSVPTQLSATQQRPTEEAHQTAWEDR